MKKRRRDCTRRHELGRVVVLLSEDLPEILVDRLDRALADSGIEVLFRQPVREASLEQAQALFAALPSRAQAVIALWLSGVGDLVSKVTAVWDWKLAFHARGTFVDDFAALLSAAKSRAIRMKDPGWNRSGRLEMTKA